MSDSTVDINIIPDGPIAIQVPCSVTLPNGEKVEQPKVFLCRCGASENKPFCDGAHKKIDFKDA